MKIAKFLQHWTAGLHGPGTWHGAGAPQTQRFMFTVLDGLRGQEEDGQEDSWE